MSSWYRKQNLGSQYGKHKTTKEKRAEELTKNLQRSLGIVLSALCPQKHSASELESRPAYQTSTQQEKQS